MPPLTLLSTRTRRLVLASKAHSLLPTATQPLLGSIYHPSPQLPHSLMSCSTTSCIYTPHLPPVPIPHELIQLIVKQTQQYITCMTQCVHYATAGMLTVHICTIAYAYSVCMYNSSAYSAVCSCDYSIWAYIIHVL